MPFSKCKVIIVAILYGLPALCNPNAQGATPAAARLAALYPEEAGQIENLIMWERYPSAVEQIGKLKMLCLAAGDTLLYAAASNGYAKKMMKKADHEILLDLLADNLDIIGFMPPNDKSDSLKAETHHNIAGIFLLKHCYDLGIRHNLAALKYAGKNPELLYRINNSIASAYFYYKDYNNAGKYSHKAWTGYTTSKKEQYDKSLRERADESNKANKNALDEIRSIEDPVTAMLYLNMANAALGNNDLGRAHGYFTKSYDILKQSGQNSKNKMERLYTSNHLLTFHADFAQYYFVKKDFAKAVHHIRKAEGELKIMGATTSTMELRLLALKGDIHLAQKEPEKALLHYQQYLDKATSFFNKVHPTVADAYLKLGNFYSQIGQHDAATKKYVQALVSLGYRKKETGLAALAAPESGIPASLTKTAKIYMAMGNNHAGEGRLWEAFDDYHSALRAAFEFCGKMVYDMDENLDYETVRSAAEGSLHTAVKLLRECELEKGEETALLDACLANIEIAKNIRYKLGVNLNDERNFENSVSAQPREFERLCAANLVYYGYLLLTENNGGTKAHSIREARPELAQKLQIAKENRDSLLRRFKAEAKPYYNIMYGQEVVGKTSTVKGLLEKAGQAQILVFFQGSENIYLLSVSDGETKLRKVGQSKNIATLADNFREAMNSAPTIEDKQQKSLYAFITQSNELYGNLFGGELTMPETDGKTFQSITIIPDGDLTNLPFEALVCRPLGVSENNSKPTSSINTSTFADICYMVNFFNISYAESVTALNKTLKSELPKCSSNYTGFGIRKNNDSQRQVTNLSNMFNGKTLLAEKATTKNLCSNINTSILHLALDADFDCNTPGNSTFDLWKPANIPANILSLDNMFGAGFKTRMLIANQINMGDQEQCQGYQHFSKCLQYLGCPSFIFSLWQGEQTINTSILENTGTLLLENNNLPYALSQSKREFLKQEPNHRHPYYWASTLFSGNPLPIKFAGKPNGAPSKLYGLLVILSISLLLLYWQYSKMAAASSAQ